MIKITFDDFNPIGEKCFSDGTLNNNLSLLDWYSPVNFFSEKYRIKLNYVSIFNKIKRTGKLCKMKSMIPIIIVFFLSSCSDGDNDKKLTPINLLDFKVSYFDTSSKLPMDTEVNENSKLIFPFISGQLFGAVSEDNLIELDFNSENEYTLNLSNEIFTETVTPNTLSEAGLGDDIIVNLNADNLLFGRLGTFSVTLNDVLNPSENFGFYDLDKESIFFLVYFDRKFHLSGSIVNDEFNISININVPEAGFYAITGGKSTEFFTNEFTATAFNPSDNIYFFIINNEDSVLNKSRVEDYNSQISEVSCYIISCVEF